MKKHRSYSNHSRKFKNKYWIGVKNTIRLNKYGHGNLFYSDQYIDEGCDWVDFYFLGKSPRVFYNACLVTPKHALYNEVSIMASDTARRLVPHHYTILPRKGLIHNEPVEFSKIFHSSDDDINADLSSFGGLSRREWCEREEQRLAAEGVVSVQSNIKLLHDYAYGIGLEGISNSNLITKDVINSFIINFLSTGERECVGATHTITPEIMDISKHRFSNALLM